jgi:pyruvate,water dikinase
MKRKKLILKGTPASVGIAEGLVRLVTESKDTPQFKEGEVLVTRITDPTMVRMMSRAAAIVCDIGGITSHPSIISRELGIPCVVGTEKATKILKTGTRVRVDGTKGTVYEL